MRRSSARWRRLPDFLVIGAQRGGTSSFYDLLARHPSVARSSRKEVHFFDERYAKGLAWYRAHFPLECGPCSGEGAPRRVTGEATPYYLFDPRVPERVRAVLPGVRLVLLLRDPVARAWSQHARERRLGREPLGFAEAVDREGERLAEERRALGRLAAYDGPHHRYHSYLARGRYAEQLERWLECFPRSSFLVLRSEDFYSDPRAALAEAERFLVLPAWRPDAVRRLQEGRGEAIPAAVRERLQRYFAPENRRLEALLGWELGWSP